jgi:hypothetical protein
MLEELTAEDVAFERVEVPFIHDYSEVDYMIHDSSNKVAPKEEYAFARWLLATETKSE